MKKAFTLAETIITIAIIGVIAAIAIPTLMNARPNKDQLVYNKASYALQSAVAVAMDSTFAVTKSDSKFWEGIELSKFCTEIANNLNTVSEINCTAAGSYESPNFETTDGIKFWGLGGNNKFQTAGLVVSVDRNMTEGEQKKYLSLRGNGGASRNINDGLKLVVSPDGKIYVPNDDNYKYERELIEDAMSKVKTEK